MKNKLFVPLAILIVMGIISIIVLVHNRSSVGKIEGQLDEYSQSIKQDETDEEESDPEDELLSLYVDKEYYEYDIEESTDISILADKSIDYLMELSHNTAARAPEFDYQYDETIEVDWSLFSESIKAIYPKSPTCLEAVVSVLSQYADVSGKNYGVFEIDGFRKAEWEEDGICGYKIQDTSTGEIIYLAYTDTGFEVVGYIYKVE